MTEDQWNTCIDPALMLEFLRRTASERRLRLFACAYTRRLWPQFSDERSKRGIKIAEQFADGLADEKEREWAWLEAGAVVLHAISEQDFILGTFVDYPKRCLETSMEKIICDSIFHFHPWVPEDLALIKDIFGNPFRPITIASSLLTPPITALAQAIYDNRIMPAGTFDPARLAELVRVLAETGCENAELLTHLGAAASPHYRGCWGIDLLLGKS